MLDKLRYYNLLALISDLFVMNYFRSNNKVKSFAQANKAACGSQIEYIGFTTSGMRNDIIMINSFTKCIFVITLTFMHCHEEGSALLFIFVSPVHLFPMLLLYLICDIAKTPDDVFETSNRYSTS